MWFLGGEATRGYDVVCRVRQHSTPPPLEDLGSHNCTRAHGQVAYELVLLGERGETAIPYTISGVSGLEKKENESMSTGAPVAIHSEHAALLHGPQ
jgi:hypothetical protein